MKKIISRATAILLIGIAGQTETSLRANDCAKVAFEGLAQLGLIEVAPNVFALGGFQRQPARASQT